MKILGNTQIGLVRSSNQDRFVIKENTELDVYGLIVLDGVGGAQAGDVASSMIADGFSLAFDALERQHSLQAYQKWAVKLISELNLDLYKASHGNNGFSGMATTCIFALLTPFGDFYINIGDSRLYKLDHRQRLVQLSTDHSLVNDLVIKGELTIKEAQNHPAKHAVTNAVGIYMKARFDLAEIILPYNMLLLCTDGLSGYVEHEIIEAILKENISLEEKIEKLNKEVILSGAYDNFTFILVENRHG